MRVCLDITAACTQRAGIARYSGELARALLQLADGLDLVLFHHGRRPWALPPDLASCRRVHLPVPERAWRAGVLVTAGVPTWAGGVDVFHGTDVIPAPVGRARVVTVHDLSPLHRPADHTRLNGWFLRRLLPTITQRADAVIAVSHATKTALVDVGVPAERVHVVHHGVDHDRFRPRDREAARRRVAAAVGTAGGYGLVVGTLEPRKNLPAILRAWSRLDQPAPLVVVGSPGWGGVSVPDEARRAGIGDRVRCPGHVSDDLLVDLYAGADVVLCLAAEEGFGLPVLEAMACGAPVLASDRSSLPEVAGDAALLVSPDDERAVAEALGALLSEPDLRDRLGVAGTRRARTFTWRRTAHETLAVYGAALAGE